MAAAEAMSGSGRSGALSDPRLLAAGAGGLLAAVAVLWTLHGLPLGGALFWLSPFPLLAAGLGFGAGAGFGAAAVAAGALLVAAGLPVMALQAAVFGAPGALAVALALGGGGGAAAGLRLGGPLALLGVWPALMALLAAVALADVPGGLEGAMRAAIETVLAQIGLSGVPAEVIDAWVRLKAPSLALLTAMALAANGAAAQGFLARRGLALAPTPRWSEARLPGWYPALPAVAGLAWLLLAPEGDVVALSVLLSLLVPVFLQGVAAVHRASRGRAGRRAMLAGFYLLLVLPWTMGLAVLAVTALGLIEQWRRRPAASSGGGKT